MSDFTFIALGIFALIVPLIAGNIITAVFTREFTIRYKKAFMLIAWLPLPALLLFARLYEHYNNTVLPLLLNTSFTFISLLCAITLSKHASKRYRILSVFNSLIFVLTILIIMLAVDAKNTKDEFMWLQ